MKDKQIQQEDFFARPMQEFYERLEAPNIPRHAARQIAREAMLKGYRLGVEKAAGLAQGIVKNMVSREHHEV